MGKLTLKQRRAQVASVKPEAEAQTAVARLRDTKFWLFILRAVLDAIVNGTPDQVPPPEYILTVLNDSNKDMHPDADAVAAVFAALPPAERAALVEKLYDTYCIRCGAPFDKLGAHVCACNAVWQPYDEGDFNEDFLDDT